MRTALIFFLFCVPFFASAAVFINEIQIAPTKERFIELYNSDSLDVDLTGWYIQRKTATGSSFGSLVTSTTLAGKTIKANGYFLISRSQLSNSDVVADLTLTESNTIRIRDSKGKDVDQIMWGSVGEGKSYQMSPRGEWGEATPTPGSANGYMSASKSTTVTPPVNESAVPSVTHIQTPEVKKVVAEAGPQTRVVLAGSPIIFEGKIIGLENASGVAPKTTWSFGDGASAEGESVTHTYYYPGEYTAILDVVSVGLKATDKMLVRVVLPNLSLSTGGNTTRSFFTIENKSNEEIDMSSWQVVSLGKTFIFPKNTILGGHRSATFASEVTALATPSGSIPELLFPNGTRVEVKSETVAVVAPAVKTIATNEDPTLRTRAQGRALVSNQVQISESKYQTASIVNSIPDSPTRPPQQKDGSLWPWYIGAAFLGALALLGIRLTRQNTEQKPSTPADDYEIIEETDDEEPR